ncbi:hypothetical protein R1sor_008015 [Riccia sorocarpa]|uniref:Uncharacterized protein n=1 Tax=Riccia sorocarpa TaxID=122646 RepID=A0ABD3HVL4_9MARC
MFAHNGAWHYLMAVVVGHPMTVTKNVPLVDNDGCWQSNRDMLLDLKRYARWRMELCRRMGGCQLSGVSIIVSRGSPINVDSVSPGYVHGTSPQQVLVRAHMRALGTCLVLVRVTFRPRVQVTFPPRVQDTPLQRVRATSRPRVQGTSLRVQGHPISESRVRLFESRVRPISESRLHPDRDSMVRPFVSRVRPFSESNPELQRKFRKYSMIGEILPR